jgi:predicted nucleotidyltransferase component of viral defense system
MSDDQCDASLSGKSCVTGRNTAASIRARLLNRAKRDALDFQFVLTKYALERLLYRLSISPQKDHFLLKGALLFDLWFDVPLRPTSDIDLLGFEIEEIPYLIDRFQSVCMLEVDDGITFDSRSIKASEIRKDANYSGIRLNLTGLIDGARCPVQIDIGYGDPVTPAPESAVYPTMFEDMAAPQLRVYPTYTVIAEKLEAIISLGMANSRMKDYFDLWVILRNTKHDPKILTAALSATTHRRGTIKPQNLPIGLTDRFGLDQQKVVQWNAFVNRNKLTAESLPETVKYISNTLGFLFEVVKD